MTATRGGEPYPRATADLHVGLAELDRELDDLASAAAHLETARALREHSTITETDTGGSSPPRRSAPRPGTTTAP